MRPGRYKRARGYEVDRRRGRDRGIRIRGLVARVEYGGNLTEHKHTLALYLAKHMAWSAATFGDGQRVEGICKHIEKELAEIRRDPRDLVEWIDVIILALDGYWRAGGDPRHVMDLLEMKQRENMARKWPAPGTVPEGEPTEHVRPKCSARVGGTGLACELEPCHPGVHQAGRVTWSRGPVHELDGNGVCMQCGYVKPAEHYRAGEPCRHDHVSMEGICHRCGADQRGMG